MRGHIHNGSPETSPRLRKTLDALLRAGDRGMTRLELRQASGGEAVNSDVSELRQYANENAVDWTIPSAKCEGKNENGSMIYRYWAYRKPQAVMVPMAPVEVVQMQDGQLAF
jgi:hypothetical protein